MEWAQVTSLVIPTQLVQPFGNTVFKYFFQELLKYDGAPTYWLYYLRNKTVSKELKSIYKNSKFLSPDRKFLKKIIQLLDFRKCLHINVSGFGGNAGDNFLDLNNYNTDNLHVYEVWRWIYSENQTKSSSYLCWYNILIFFWQK